MIQASTVWKDLLYNYIFLIYLQANSEEGTEEVNVLEKLLHMFRYVVGQPEGFAFTITLFVIGLVMTFLDPNVKVLEWPDV